MVTMLVGGVVSVGPVKGRSVGYLLSWVCELQVFLERGSAGPGDVAVLM